MWLGPVLNMGELKTPELLQGRERRLSGSIILGVPIVLIIVTFLFWYQTWFGRQLSDSELREYLQDTSVPHKTQHALTQVTTEILKHDPSVEGVYPLVIALGGNKEAGLRSMAAWVMGQDNKSVAFHQALLTLVADPEPTVRWNAALGLARFGDATGEPQLRLMLRPYNLAAPASGVITFRLNAADAVRTGTIVARIKTQSSEVVEVRSPVAGIMQNRMVGDEATIAAGDAMATISPDDQQVWEALRALYLVGRPDDIGDVNRFAGPVAGMSDRVRQQAILTAGEIQKRMAISDGPGRMTEAHTSIGAKQAASPTRGNP
jgi:HEAT repeat protein